MSKTFPDLISNCEVDELWSLYGLVEAELKKNGQLRTRNITAERGEQIALQTYNTIPNEPKLHLVPQGTQNVDAISRNGKRYAIKTARLLTRALSTFQSDDFSKQRFDYLIVVILDRLYQPIQVLEAPWDVVNKYKRYHKTMGAYNISLTKLFRNECRLVYPKLK